MNDRQKVFVEPFSASMARQIAVKEIIYSKRTAFQKADVVDTSDYGITLFLDDRFQTSEKDEFFYHESLVHPAMMLHPDPKRVLIIGGGDGGTLEELTRYASVESIRMVELDGEVVDIAKTHLQKICGKAFEDPRLKLSIGDGRAFIENTAETYDIILLDLTDPLEPSKYVYTKEFYTHCRNHLNKNGILSLHNDSPFFYPEAFNVISKTLDAVFAHKCQYLTYILGYMLDFAFAVCSSSPLPDLNVQELKERLERHRISDLLYYSPEMHLHQFVLPGYVKKILETPCDVSTDVQPYVLNEMP